MIPEVNPYNNYRGDGLATRFDYDFLIENSSQLIVEKINENDEAVKLVNGVDYEIKEIGNNNGGYIVFPIATSEHKVLAENETISLQLTLPVEQVSEYGQSSLLNLESLEFSLDYLTRLIQILKRKIERSVKANEGNDIIDITLPPPKANNTFAWNEDCSALVNYDIIGENNAFKNEMVKEFQSARDEFNTTIATNKQEILDIQEQFEGETNAAIKDFEDGIDAKIATVADAADRINDLDADLAIATNAAAQATQDAQNAKLQAEIAANKADEILNVKDELEAEITTKADVDLSNLSDVGEKHFLGKSQISNCIKEAPQRIKIEVEANSNVLTLKAGSVLTTPNGANVFNEETITSDDVWTIKNDNTYLLFKGHNYVTIEKCVSGATDSLAGTAYHVWYDTTNNKVKLYTSDGVTSYQTSLPFAQVTVKNGVVTIDEVFDTFGYIGNVLFDNKQMKYLAVNGKEENGTYKSIERETNKVSIYEIPNTANGDFYLGYNSTTKLEYYSPSVWSYNEKLNSINYNNSPKYGMMFGGTFSTANGKIYNFKPKKAFRAVDYSDFENLSDNFNVLNSNALLDSDKAEITSWGFPSNKYTDLTLGESGKSYTAPAEGWFAFAKTETANNQSMQFTNASNGIQLILKSPTNSGYAAGSFQCSKGQNITIHYTLGGNTRVFRFIYAKGAQ